MNGSLVADLGIGTNVWVFGTLLFCVTLFFKFGRFWSIRNLDLVLVFALAPGMMILVSNRNEPPWWAFFWLFLGSLLWLVRCLLDLGLTRRPLLEPNLNASGLACLAIGVIGLFIARRSACRSRKAPSGTRPTRNPTSGPRSPPASRSSRKP